MCVSDPPGCVCGFVSVERMRLLLGLDTVRDWRGTHRRQQVTPEMKFTCDGLITKWIVGAQWFNSNNLYPELQVWSNVVDSIYRKINGTIINIETQSSNRLYEYEVFPPIPVQAGDVLGAFIPYNERIRLRLLSERDRGPTNYYIETRKNASESPYDTIDIDSTPSLESQVYHPLVTVEISELVVPNFCYDCIT